MPNKKITIKKAVHKNLDLYGKHFQVFINGKVLKDHVENYPARIGFLKPSTDYPEPYDVCEVHGKAPSLTGFNEGGYNSVTFCIPCLRELCKLTDDEIKNAIKG